MAAVSSPCIASAKLPNTAQSFNVAFGLLQAPIRRTLGVKLASTVLIVGGVVALTLA